MSHFTNNLCGNPLYCLPFSTIAFKRPLTQQQHQVEKQSDDLDLNIRGDMLVSVNWCLFVFFGFGPPSHIKHYFTLSPPLPTTPFSPCPALPSLSRSLLHSHFHSVRYQYNNNVHEITMELNKHDAEILYKAKGRILFFYSMCTKIWSVFAMGRSV